MKFKITLLYIVLFAGTLFNVVFGQNNTLAIKTVKANTLSVGIDLTYAPYAYIEDGIPKGFDPDLMRLIANKLGVKVEFKDTRIENIIIGLNANHYDVVASALYVNPQRAKQVDFLPYLQTGGVLVVRKGEDYHPKNLTDLCGKKISSMKGASWISTLNAISESYCLPNNQQSIEVREFPSAPEAAQALLSKGVDVQYEDAAVAKMVIDEQGNRLEISTTEMLEPVLIGLAFNKSSIELRVKIQETINELKQTGEYNKLLKKYNLAYPSQELLQKNTAYLANNTDVNKSKESKKFDWDYLSSILFKKEFLSASITVIILSALAWIIAVVFGFLLALSNLSKNRLLNTTSGLYIWFFRSLPLLVLLIFIYNLPQVWPASSLVFSSPFATGLIALVLSESAYMAEIHRGALISIPKGQTEAAKALGIKFVGIQRFIIIPQALRIALPSLANQYVTIIKITSLVSVISLTEILLVGQQLYTRNFMVIETLVVVAFYYVLIISVVTWVLKRVEDKLDISKNRVNEKNSKKIEEGISLENNRLSSISNIYKNGENALEVLHAQKEFNSQVVLNNISLSIKWGEVVSIIGPSGSGKTTLIRSMNGLEPLDSGEIKLHGKPFLFGHKGKNKINSKDYNKDILHIGMVFQSYNLFPHKTALENIILAPAYHKKYDTKVNRNEAFKMLKKVGLLEHAHKYPYQLSGGQQQRVAIARSLVMQPSIVLFDEPTSALDPTLVKDVLKVIEELAREGMTMVIVTHEMKFAVNVSDRIIYMENGQIIYDLPPQEIVPNKDPRLKHYFEPEDYSI